jgi:hypothetical protein
MEWEEKNVDPHREHQFLIGARGEHAPDQPES